jgi:hypothetical protein
VGTLSKVRPTSGASRRLGRLSCDLMAFCVCVLVPMIVHMNDDLFEPGKELGSFTASYMVCPSHHPPHLLPDPPLTTYHTWKHTSSTSIKIPSQRDPSS